MTAANRTGGFKALRFAGIVALAGFGVAAFVIVGSYLFLQSEKKANAASQRSLQEIGARLSTIKREHDDLQGSEETYKSLIAQGAFAPERRLDLIEAFEQLKKKHRLIGLEYDVSSQRPLKFATGANFAAVNILASRIRMKVQAYHDGDLLAFLDEFPRIHRGFFPIDRCVIKRVASPERSAKAAPEEVGQQAAEMPSAAAVAQAAVEADCSMEWITLVDKSKSASMQATVDLRKPL